LDRLQTPSSSPLWRPWLILSSLEWNEKKILEPPLKMF
jgi:hypothetical protein